MGERNPLAEKATYIERITGWLIDASVQVMGDPTLGAEARAGVSLDGVYEGSSPRIRRIERLAYLRGVRRGASVAWQARRPISLRDACEALAEARLLDETRLPVEDDPTMEAGDGVITWPKGTRSQERQV